MTFGILVTDDGDVYISVPIELIGRYLELGFELFIKDNDDIVKFDQVAHKGRDCFVYVADIATLMKFRARNIRTFDDVKKYIRRHGSFPWGIKQLCKANGWKRVSENGYSVSLVDKHGDIIRYNNRSSDA